MAIEVLLNKKYGLAADWWSFGILIYVMLIGKYPFHGEDESEILDAILSDAIDYPPGMPGTTQSLIQAVRFLFSCVLYYILLMHLNIAFE